MPENVADRERAAALIEEWRGQPDINPSDPAPVVAWLARGFGGSSNLIEGLLRSGLSVPDMWVLFIERRARSLCEYLASEIEKRGLTPL